MNYVYCITDGTNIKIGKANNVSTRLNQLQVGNSSRLVVLGVIECEDEPTAYCVEKELHCLYIDKKVIGEWFNIPYKDITEIDKRFIPYKEVEPQHMKIYDEGRTAIASLTKAATKVLFTLFIESDSNNNINLTSSIKKRIVEDLRIAMKTLDKTLQDLANKGIIERVSRGVYTLNPYLFGKGDWKTIDQLRSKNIHLQIIYNKDTNTRIIKGDLV